MKNTTDEIDSCPAPQRLGIKLPINPPTNPPMYVGPLRTNPSSDNSTAETMSCSGYGQTGGRPCQPSRRSGGAGSDLSRLVARVSGALPIPTAISEHNGLPSWSSRARRYPLLSPPVVAPCFGRRQMFGYRGPHDRYPTSTTRCSPLISPCYLKEPGPYSTRRVPRLGIFGTGLGAFARTASSKVRP
jgi:hypothetical protein